MQLIKNLAILTQPILNIPIIRRIRRNHGLEHATIHILSRGKSSLRMAGRSDDHGFYLYGDISTGEVTQAVSEALRRMQSGEHNLAIHPNCGTNLVTTGMLSALAALVGTAGMQRDWRDRMERFPTVVLLIIAALIVAPGIGTAFQRYFTTLGEPGDLHVVDIQRREVTTPLGGKMIIHRVETAGG